ncbi:Hypothetical protein NocV09_00100460 [Nannochloropsis oceanica]
METAPQNQQRDRKHIHHVTQEFSSIDEGCQDDHDCDSSDLSSQPNDSLSHYEGEPSLSTCSLRPGLYQHTGQAPHQLPLVDTYARLLLPSTRMGIIIGRRGEAIRSICDITGAHVSIASLEHNKRDSAHRMVVVMGSAMSVCWAVDLLAQKAGLFEGYSNIHPHHKSRKHLKTLVSTPTSSSVPTRIDLKEATSPTSASRVRKSSPSGEDGIIAASSHEKFELSPPGIKMVIDSSKAGLLLGKGGVIISKIRSKSKARVLLLDQSLSAKEGAIANERILIIIGKPDYCRRAHQLIIAALSASPLTPEDVLHHQQGGSKSWNHPQEPQFIHQQPSASQATFSDDHQYQLAAAPYFSVANHLLCYPSSEHMNMTTLSQSMSHLCMTDDGPYILSPYATVPLLPNNHPSPQVYYLAQTLAPSNFQIHQQQKTVQKKQQEQQLHPKHQQEDSKAEVQNIQASIPGTEEQKV